MAQIKVQIVTKDMETLFEIFRLIRAQSKRGSIRQQCSNKDFQYEWSIDDVDVTDEPLLEGSKI